jgi:hypothetical protein
MPCDVGAREAGAIASAELSLTGAAEIGVARAGDAGIWSGRLSYAQAQFATQVSQALVRQIGHNAQYAATGRRLIGSRKRSMQSASASPARTRVAPLAKSCATTAALSRPRESSQ